jgi:hypothetical protein
MSKLRAEVAKLDTTDLSRGILRNMPYLQNVLNESKVFKIPTRYVSKFSSFAVISLCPCKYENRYQCHCTADRRRSGPQVSSFHPQRLRYRIQCILDAPKA